MQSQQKRVKWSRGETAEALEERTDTGITQASVSFMENCIPDLYGNISRRPGLKIIETVYPENWDAGFTYDEYLQVIPFYITETDYILVGIHYDSAPELIRVKDGFCRYRAVDVKTGGNQYPKTRQVASYKPVSYAQQNNYMLIADSNNVYKLRIEFGSDNEFIPILDLWEFTGGWYAPTGTQTQSVSNTEVTGLSFSANSIKNYIYTENNGQTTVYSSIKTGISLIAISGTWSGQTTTFYAHVKNKSAWPKYCYCYLDKNSSGSVASFTMTNNAAYNNNQTMCSFTVTETTFGHYATFNAKVKIRIESDKTYFYFEGVFAETYDCTENFTNTSTPDLVEHIPLGSIVQFPNNGAYMRVEGFDSDGTDLIMFGSLMTPVADSSATDTSVNVESNYLSLQPGDFSNTDGNYPHPKKLLFSEQRLWAGAWAFSNTEEYALTLGSQIARYDDLKNNYNQENEPITLDILTQYKERILHLVDYNGLKIMTDSYEYAYENGGVVKQSANGSFEYCEPIVFDSLCLYIDSTGCQVKAMQYEFQSNIFNSTTINQFAPHDLVWYPWAMAQYEDKVNNTGKYLFLVNRKDANARLAVCNFVPSNQANIWNRWAFANFVVPGYTNEHSTLHSVVNTKMGTIFMVKLGQATIRSDVSNIRIHPAQIDFNASTDFESEPLVITVGGSFEETYFAPVTEPTIGTMPNTDVAIYADGVFQFITTTDSTGKITADLSELTNVTVGLPISAKVISHPIDVGGKTKSIKKRIAKTVLSVHGTEPGAITINGKTGYMNPQKDKINFYGVTGMKDEIKYTLTNNNGAMFHLESLLMNIEYGTLIS